MKNIIFISPPAAGKGTYSKLINDKYNIPHISTGDLLREEVAKQTKLGQELKEQMEKGAFIKDEIITDLLKERLSKEDYNNGYILDGYPRNIEQAKTYEKILQELNKEIGIVIFLDIDKDLALKRALGRIVCPKCGSSYNNKIEEFKPKKEGICNRCNSKLEVRTDDNEETFINRFNTYLEKTKALIEYYKEKGILKEIKSEENDNQEKMLKKIKEIIEND